MAPLSKTPAGLLRNNFRLVASRTRPSHGFAATQIRHQVVPSDGDPGGPGGQEPPPPNPGGPEAIKRNWVPIGGAALAAVAAFAYWKNPKAKGTIDKAKQTDGTNSKSNEESLSEDADQLGKRVGQQVAEQASKTMKEMSGRQKTEQGSFRHD